MDLTSSQLDALTELINIGFGRAAASLSVLVGQKIVLEAPELQVCAVSQLNGMLEGQLKDQAFVINQTFSGGVTGDVFMFMSPSSASALVDLLGGGEGKTGPLNASDREALIEVGNIILNAYIGSLSNTTRSHVDLGFPKLNTQTIRETINFFANKAVIQYILLVKTNFHLQSSCIDGYVMLVVGVDSLEALVHTLSTARGNDE